MISLSCLFFLALSLFGGPSVVAVSRVVSS